MTKISIGYSEFSIDKRVAVDLDTMVEDVDLDGDGFGSLDGFRLLDGALLVYVGSGGHAAVVAFSAGHWPHHPRVFVGI